MAPPTPGSQTRPGLYCDRPPGSGLGAPAPHSSTARAEYAVEQFFQVLVVALQSADQNAVVGGQREKRTGHPIARGGNPVLSPSIVLEHADPIKGQLAEKEL